MAKDSLLSFTKDVKDRTALRYHLPDSTKEMGKRKSLETLLLTVRLGGEWDGVESLSESIRDNS